jgi:hypothetical protein
VLSSVPSGRRRVTFAEPVALPAPVGDGLGRSPPGLGRSALDRSALGLGLGRSAPEPGRSLAVGCGPGFGRSSALAVSFAPA